MKIFIFARNQINNMKNINYLIVLLLLLITKTVSAQYDDSKILSIETNYAVKEFETAIQYLTNKNISFEQKRLVAESFAKRFKTGAVVEVTCKSRTLKLAPLQFFYRLIREENKTNSIHLGIKRQNFILSTDFHHEIKAEIVMHTIYNKNIVYETRVSSYSIKSINIYFIYTPTTNTWVKRISNVKVFSDLEDF